MKKLFVLLTIMIAMLTAASAMAEATITVNGTGEIRVSADTAVISLGVSARDEDVLQAQQRVNESIAAIRAVLSDQGVKDENINTEFINIYAGADTSAELAQQAVEIFTEICPDAEINLVDGGQPVYYFMISAE